VGIEGVNTMLEEFGFGAFLMCMTVCTPDVSVGMEKWQLEKLVLLMCLMYLQRGSG